MLIIDIIYLNFLSDNHFILSKISYVEMKNEDKDVKFSTLFLFQNVSHQRPKNLKKVQNTKNTKNIL